jgi:hypothetical protein
MKAIITQQDGLFLVTLMNQEYKDIFVADELYLNNSKVNSDDLDLAEWIAKEVNYDVDCKRPYTRNRKT